MAAVMAQTIGATVLAQYFKIAAIRRPPPGFHPANLNLSTVYPHGPWRLFATIAGMACNKNPHRHQSLSPKPSVSNL